jgi:hypothetical protein
MSPDEAGQFIAERIRVERADVAAIKSFAVSSVDAVLAENENDRAAGALLVQNLALAWLKHAKLGAPWSRQTATDYHHRLPGIDIGSANAEVQLTQAARALSNVMAAHEAVWELVQAGELLPIGSLGVWRPDGFGWQTPSGGGGITIPGPTSTAPERIMRAPWRRQSIGALWDADLYARDLPVDLHPGILEALREAVECFRRDLFLPCLAMLTAAAEGMWTETGTALLGAAARHDKDMKKLEDALTADRGGLSWLVSSAAAAYARKDLFGPVQKASGAHDLAAEQQWTDAVRDGRNVLHWGVGTVTANSYSKVATLLQVAPLRFKTLADVRRAARAQAATP